MLDVKKLSQKIIININEYEKVWNIEDMPLGEGCIMKASDEDGAAWLEVRKQEIKNAPSVPERISKWVKGSSDPDVLPQIINKKSSGSATESGIVINDYAEESQEKFEDDENRVTAYKSFLKEWKAWADESSFKSRVQKLYNELFSLHQRLQREEDDVEIAFGHGVLSWNIGGKKIKRPLIVTPLELKFDAKGGIFLLCPTSKGSFMETDMLSGIDLPQAKRLQEIQTKFNDEEINIWDADVINPMFCEIANIISPEGRYFENDEDVKDFSCPVIKYSPLIFLRKKNTRTWNSELSDCVEKIKNGYPVPDSIKLLVTNDKCEIKDENTNPDEWKSVGEDLLFPLPSNEEQKMIAKKLAEGPGVVVEGPPGTGKSHTIANLICHLLAHGKRVLVTSEKERALKVLRDKIPDEIKPLCAPMLGGDSESMRDIENSIKNIAECLDSYDPDSLKKDIDALKSELYGCRKRTAEIKSTLNIAGELENRKVAIDDKEMTPLEMGRWIAEEKVHDWMPDAIKITDDLPLSDDDMNMLFALAKNLKKEDIESVKKNRPKICELPLPSEFETQCKNLLSFKNKYDENLNLIEGWNTQNVEFEKLDKVKAQLTDAINFLQSVSCDWQKNILEDSICGNNEIWNDFVSDINVRVEEIEKLNKELIEYEVSVPDGVNAGTALCDLLSLKKKINGGGKIGWLMKNITGRKYSYIFQGMKVNGLEAKDESDIDVLINYFMKTDTARKTEVMWNHMMEGIGGPCIGDSIKSKVLFTKKHIIEIKNCLMWNEHMTGELKNFIQNLCLFVDIKWTDSEALKRVYSGIETLEIKKNYDDSKNFFMNLKAFLVKGKESLNAHESYNMLLNAVDKKDLKLYERQYMELVRIEGIEKDCKNFELLLKKLSERAPVWANNIENSCGSEYFAASEDYKKAWRISRFKSYLDSIHENTDIQKLENSLADESKIESRILKELVSKSTWLSQIERTTEPEKRSLFAWLKAVQRIGKGTGKYAGMYRKEAAREMKTCRSAIPVWIMPIQKVIENIQLTDNLFDVVIVDESSQSNLFSLCAILRAKKAVIVGDENQISPESVGMDVGDVSSLINKHLEGIPQSGRFEMKTSLYDMANQVFNSKILLKEHFRCVPEIIQFSNDLMYDGKMIPLRLPMSNDMFDPPVSEVFVSSGFRDENTSKIINRPEAEALVNKIKECTENPRYNNKTMGVISLLGHDQANIIEEMLRSAIGEEEMVKRKMLCGDAYYFQGAERDIIFLSMVAAPNMRMQALTKRSDYQRFNVASSRARDQMFLYHSVQLNDLNPECARYKLLEYCMNPHRVQDSVQKYDDVFESVFERDVFKIISARGYKVIPQVKVGTLGKRIDMVVEGMRSRLAVECDGDRWHGIDRWEQDLERQTMLERVGWTFFRVRGSTFYRDPEKALAPLWIKLDEMSIEPYKLN